MSNNSTNSSIDMFYVQGIRKMVSLIPSLWRWFRETRGGQGLSILSLIAGLGRRFARQWLSIVLLGLALALLAIMVINRQNLLALIKEWIFLPVIVSGIVTLSLPTYLSRWRKDAAPSSGMIASSNTQPPNQQNQPPPSRIDNGASDVQGVEVSLSPTDPDLSLRPAQTIRQNAALQPIETVASPYVQVIDSASSDIGSSQDTSDTDGQSAEVSSVPMPPSNTDPLSQNQDANPTAASEAAASVSAVSAPDSEFHPLDSTEIAIITWFSFSICMFFVSEWLLILSNDCGTMRFHPDDCGYPLSQFLLLIGMGALIAIYIQWYKPLAGLLTEYASLIDLGGVSPQLWVEQQMRRVFRPNNPVTMLVIGLTTGVLFAIMLVLDFPFQNGVIKAFGYIALLIIAFIGGHGIYMAMALYHLLYHLVKYDIRSAPEHTPDSLRSIAFYNWPHPIVAKIRNYYIMNFSIVVVIAYLWLLLLISTSPFGLNILFLAFLSVLALFPFPAFLWTAWQTSAISEKIQAKSIEIVNQQVATLYTKGDIETFEKWMAIQDRLINKPRIEPRMTLFLTGIFAVLTIILQTIVNIQEILGDTL